MQKNSHRVAKACLGKYVAFCDGDDYWHDPEKLQKQVNYLENHPECGLLFADCDLQHVRTGKSIRNFNYQRGFRSFGNLTSEELWRKWGVWTLTAIVRRHLYDDVIEKDPDLHQNDKFLVDDFQLWLELSLLSTVTYIPESLATYRSLDESVSNSQDVKKQLRFWKSYHEMRLYLCDKHKLPQNVRTEAQAAWFDQAIRLAFYEKDSTLASEVKSKKNRLTWKEWLLYLGAKNLAVHRACRAAIFSLNRFRRPQDLRTSLGLPGTPEKNWK
jgi:glycosyltransferase involved in cell wall biosynthesis